MGLFSRRQYDDEYDDNYNGDNGVRDHHGPGHNYNSNNNNALNGQRETGTNIGHNDNRPLDHTRDNNFRHDNSLTGNRGQNPNFNNTATDGTGTGRLAHDPVHDRGRTDNTFRNDDRSRNMGNDNYGNNSYDTNGRGARHYDDAHKHEKRRQGRGWFGGGRNRRNDEYANDGRMNEKRTTGGGLFGGERRDHQRRNKSSNRRPYDIDSGEFNRRPSFGQWLKFFWIDVLTMIIMGAIALGVYEAQPAPSRSFPVTFQNGNVVYPQFAYPLRKNIIPIWAAALIASLVPIVVILLMQIRIRSFWDVNNAIIGLLYSLITSAVFQVFLKWLIGGLRPHFLSVCDPDPAKVASGGTGFNNIMFNRSICRGNGAQIDDSLESFPSGHSTASWAGFLFLYFYLNAKMKVFSNYHPSMWKIILLYAPILGATLITGSLTIDEFHNWYDCLAGAVIGSVMAISAYRMVYASVWDFRFNHIPLTRHTPFSYGAGPAGAGGFESTVFTRSAGWGFEEAYGGAPFDAAHGLRGQETGFNTGAQGRHHGAGILGHKKNGDIERNAADPNGNNMHHNDFNHDGVVDGTRNHGRHNRQDLDDDEVVNGNMQRGHHNRRDLNNDGALDTSRHHNRNDLNNDGVVDGTGHHNRNDVDSDGMVDGNRYGNNANPGTHGGGMSEIIPGHHARNTNPTIHDSTTMGPNRESSYGNEPITSHHHHSGSQGAGVLSSTLPGNQNSNTASGGNFISKSHNRDGSYENDPSALNNDDNVTGRGDARYHHSSRSLERKRVPTGNADGGVTGGAGTRF